MSKNDITRQKIKSKISAIKKIKDEYKKISTDDVYEIYKDDLASKEDIVKKRINDFTSKAKGRNQNKKDVFSEIIDTVEGFLNSNKSENGDKKSENGDKKNKPLKQKKILKYSKQSANVTMHSSKQVIINEVKKIFFGGAGLCDANSILAIPSVQLAPSSFDLMNVLKVDPDSVTGKMVYESQIDSGHGDIKFNRVLYENFDSESPYVFTTKSNVPLFSLSWDSGTQQYGISELTPTMKIGDFLDGYYNTIEEVTIDDVLKNAMLLALQGDGSTSSLFQNGMDCLNRLTQKIFSLCGSPSNDNVLMNNATDQINEDEQDIKNYFNFDDVEGIDLDDEDARKRKVLKFRDCNNFEIPINSNHTEDFTYLLDKKNLDENIENTLNKAAIDASEQSDSIPFDNFQISIMNSYISKIPKAIISNVLSPKMMFPIAVIYKSLKSNNVTIKDIMKILSNLFFNIIKSLYWIFIREFWKLVKNDLLIFLREIGNKILRDSMKKHKKIISILIKLLTKILEVGIDNCESMFNVILETISFALNGSIKIPIPGLLLILSESLPGFSKNRAYMNSIERMEAAGINTGPIYGTENKLPSLVKAIIDGHTDEMDENSYIKIALKPGVIPTSPGGAIISPLISGAGKLF